MNNPITDKELNAGEMRVAPFIDETNCADHYRIDVLVMRRRLKKYGPGSPTYSILLDEFVMALTDKYWMFIEDMQDGMPENDLEIYADLEGKEYEPQ